MTILILLILLPYKYETLIVEKHSFKKKKEVS